MTETPTFARPDPAREYLTPERCHVLESWNDGRDGAASIARARVEPGVATQPHRLRGVVERYLIVEGEGVATVGDIEKAVRMSMWLTLGAAGIIVAISA